MGWCWVPSWVTHFLRAEIPSHTPHTNLGGSNWVWVERWWPWSPNAVKVKCKWICIIIALQHQCLCEFSMPPGYLSIMKQSNSQDACPLSGHGELKPPPPTLTPSPYLQTAWTRRQALTSPYYLTVLVNSIHHSKRILPRQWTWLLHTETCRKTHQVSTESINRGLVLYHSLNSCFYESESRGLRRPTLHQTQIPNKIGWPLAPLTQAKLHWVMSSLTVVCSKLSFVSATGCVDDIWGASMIHHWGPFFSL